jgi:hypothetical protein
MLIGLRFQVVGVVSTTFLETFLFFAVIPNSLMYNQRCTRGTPSPALRKLAGVGCASCVGIYCLSVK